MSSSFFSCVCVSVLNQAEVDQKPLDWAARYLIYAQMEDGDFPQQVTKLLH